MNTKVRTHLLGLIMLGLILLPACQSDGEDDGMNQGAQATTRTISWDQIKTGMGPNDVLSLLGEPVNAKVTRVRTTWYYSNRGAQGPHVVFDTRQNRVDSWRTP